MGHVKRAALAHAKHLRAVGPGRDLAEEVSDGGGTGSSAVVTTGESELE